MKLWRNAFIATSSEALGWVYGGMLKLSQVRRHLYESMEGCFDCHWGEPVRCDLIVTSKGALG